MLSVIVPFRNRASMTILCLQSLFETFKYLGQAQNVEFILIDDASDAGSEVVPLLLEFRKNTTSSVWIIHFKERQHYTRGCAYAFSRARGDIFLLSHDMVLTPECVQTMLQVAALDPLNGIVRATANYVDCFPQHVVIPPFPLRDVRDVRPFSRYVAEYFGLHFVEVPHCVGDIMLIKREVIAKIGTMDSRYYGYFGDSDLGLRAQRCGFNIVCAEGAWLFHEGAGYYKQESQTKKVDMALIQQNRMVVVNDAYKLFREKWDTSLPADYASISQIDFAKLRHPAAGDVDLFQPLVEPSPALADVL